MSSMSEPTTSGLLKSLVPTCRCICSGVEGSNIPPWLYGKSNVTNEMLAAGPIFLLWSERSVMCDNTPTVYIEN